MDCCEAMYQRKLDDYADHLPQLESQQIRYIPMTFSCYGRVHPEAVRIIELIAKQAARKRGLGDHRLLLRRSLAAIGVQLWRRAAAMVRVCLPKLTAEEAATLFGADPAGESDLEVSGV